jgi:hypothetical protein
VKYDLGIVKEDDLDELVGQPEYDGVLGAHPFLDHHGLGLVSLHDEVLLPVDRVVEVASEVLEQGYLLLELLWVGL